jgi:single-strand DNA-binding protein
MPDNAISIAGGLGRDPELRYTASGRAMANFGVAVERRWQKDGEWTGETSWFNVTCWGDLAEHAAETLTKGTRVVVIGRLQQRSWETNEGEKRYVVEIVADDIGPSLKWASAQVTKHQREKYDNRGPDNDPPPNPEQDDPFP